MTIANETNKSGPYFYNGAATSFGYGFKIADATHIRVVETVVATGVETDLVLNTDYTVTGVGNDTGSVVISPARAAGKSATLVRNVPFTQPIVLENQGAYFAKVVEQALDNSVARDQQLAEQINRAVVVPVSADPTDLETLIAGVVALLDNVDDVVTVAGISTQVVAVAANAASISTVAANIVGVQTTAANIAAILAAPALVAAAAAAADATAADRAAVATNKGLVDTAKTAVDVAKAAADADVVLTHADVVLTHADVVLTHADAAATAADRVQTGLDRSAAAASAASVAPLVVKMDARPSLIVNGSMQDSPENGTTLGTVNGYFPAEMWALYFTASTAAMSAQLISTRTLSGNDRAIEFKTTTAKGSLAATDFVTLTTIVEGSRPEWKAAAFGTASAKPFVHRFEVTLPAGLYHWHFQNSAGNLHCTVPFTVSAPEANVQTVKSVVLPACTTGTWLFADGDKGLVAELVLAAGATLTGGTASVWGATLRLAATTQFNILSSTSNVARLADVGLKNDPDATTVYGLFRVGEKDATYRAERYFPSIVPEENSAPIGAGQAIAAGSAVIFVPLNIDTSKKPTGVSPIDSAQYRLYNSAGSAVTVAVVAFNTATRKGLNLAITVASGLTAGNATALLFANTTVRLLVTGCRL